MHVIRLRALIAGAVFSLSLPVHSATLSTLLEQAWQRSPSARGIVAREAEIAAARELSSAWIAGQPVVGLSQRNGRRDDHGRQRESELSVGAPFWTAGQRSARQNLAALSAAELQAQSRKLRLELAGEVRARFWDAAAAQALLEEKEGHLHHAEDLAVDIRRRVVGGELARVDSLLAEQEVHAGRVAVEHAKGERHASLARLQMLTGTTSTPDFSPEPLLTMTTPDNPALQAAQASARRAQAALQLAQASRSAPPTLSLSMRQERDAALPGPERSVGVALQVPLGSAGRNRPAETLARTQLTVAAAEAEQAALATESERALAHMRLALARSALAAADARVLAMREHQQLLEKAFQLGERSLADLLRSRALAHESEVAQRQQQVALGRAHSQLNQASGVLP